MQLLLLFFLAQLRVKLVPRLLSDARNLVDLLKSEHSRPADKYMIVQLKRLQAIMDADCWV